MVAAPPTCVLQCTPDQLPPEIRRELESWLATSRTFVEGEPCAAFFFVILLSPGSAGWAGSAGSWWHLFLAALPYVSPSAFQLPWQRLVLAIPAHNSHTLYRGSLYFYASTVQP